MAVILFRPLLRLYKLRNGQYKSGHHNSDCFSASLGGRCNFSVTDERRQIWSVELDLYKEFARVCALHDIKYQIAYGTLLGAVRHAGFIPWDDDFDVWMDRDNYEKFIKIGPAEFKEPYFLQTPLSDRSFFSGLCRLRNSMTTAIIKGFESKSYNNGIYIDIYVLDGLTDRRVAWMIQRFSLLAVIKFLTLYHQSRPRSRALKDVVFFALKPICRLFSYEQWVSIYDCIISWQTYKVDRLSCLICSSWRGKDYWVTKEEIQQTVYLQFEGLVVPAPAAYADILTRIYGCYMDCPAVDDRGTWHKGLVYFDPAVPFSVYFQGRQYGFE